MDEFVLDHSLLARKHAQTVAGLIADESRMNSHLYEDPEQVFETLIRHQRQMRLQYKNEEDNAASMPVGMLEHEVYILQ